MNRIPPNLLYLTIYNPTLRPSAPVEDDNEDAEEQAHILFYTSRERAVSRDRMLRQIGLAKALVNFAELFDPDDPCNNVHSQSKRMVMVSPEPNFWIHTGIEIAKVPRVAESKNKARPKGKPTDKGKAKEQAPIYDYEDGSVHDGAVRAHVMKGYEQFKLTHGSFTSILSNLGQQALELQLERFWTVWAWSWDLEEGPDFGEDFGPLLHPYFSCLIPLADDFSTSLSDDTIPVILSRLYIIPSTRYSNGRHPASLANHLSSMIPPRLDSSPSSDTLNALASSVDTIRGRQPPSDTAGGTFLGMPAVNMNMDMRKWNWPGYLTFGRGNATKPPTEKPSNPAVENEKDLAASSKDSQQENSQVEVEVNADALEDAISSDSMSVASRNWFGSVNDEREVISGLHNTNDLNERLPEGRPSTADDVLYPRGSSSSSPSITLCAPAEDTPPPTPPPLPEFHMTRVHLAPFQGPTATKRVTVHYTIRSDFMLALINTQEQTTETQESENQDLHTATEKVFNLFDDIESTIYDAGLRSVSDSVPSATQILQPQDCYLISTGQYTSSSPGFASKSSHLFNAKAILDTDSEITEVFSRGQNPQHWHVAKRGLGSTNDPIENSGAKETVFMEVFRKETSLTDVDNVLAGVIKKSGLVDGAPKLR